MLCNDFGNSDNNAKTEYLYKKYRYLMLKIAYDMLNDELLAEDVVQQSFERIIKNIHKVDVENIFKTRSFLVIICRNVANDFRKKRISLNRNIDYIEEIEDESNNFAFDPSDIILDKIVLDQILKCIDKMKVIHRDVMLLKFYYDYDYTTIAELLNIEVTTARKRYERGKGELIKLLNKEGLYGKK